MMGFLCLIACLLVVSCAGSELEWGYGSGPGGPAHWKTMFPEYCAGSLQSPINIDTKKAKEVRLDFLNLQGFSCQDRPQDASMRVENNGHTVQLHIQGDFFIDGGGLPGKRYKVAQLHYHWGNPNGMGSEHAINGRKYHAEMHLVTFDINYASLTEAKSHVDGIAVFAAMVKVGINPNFEGSAMDEFVSALPNVQYEGDSYSFPKSQLTDLSGFLPDNIDRFYRYRGSLTTPHCDEHVVWTVWQQPIRIPQQKMQNFYHLYSNNADDTEKLMDNYRPLQAVNGREILHPHRK